MSVARGLTTCSPSCPTTGTASAAFSTGSPVFVPAFGSPFYCLSARAKNALFPHPSRQMFEKSFCRVPVILVFDRVHRLFLDGIFLGGLSFSLLDHPFQSGCFVRPGKKTGLCGFGRVVVRRAVVLSVFRTRRFCQRGHGRPFGQPLDARRRRRSNRCYSRARW